VRRSSKRHTTAVTIRVDYWPISLSALKSRYYLLGVVEFRALSGRKGAGERRSRSARDDEQFSPGAGGRPRIATSAVFPVVERQASGLRRADRDLGTASTGMAGHEAVGEEATAVGVVLAGARPSGGLFGAVRDGPVTMHDQLSETAPHPSPPHRRRRRSPAGCPFPGVPGSVSGAASAQKGAFLRGIRNMSPIWSSRSANCPVPLSEVA
jgi:hypothetical protein